MSLLIKALASAEKGKQADHKKGRSEAPPVDALGLEPLTPRDADFPAQSAAAEAPANRADALNAAAAASIAKVKQQSELGKDHQQHAAANVFVANQAAKQPASISALLSLGVAGALTIWLGLQGYEYFTTRHAAETLAVAPDSQVTASNTAAGVAEQPAQIIEPEANVADTQGADATSVAVNDQATAQKPDLAQPAATAAQSVFGANNAVASAPEKNHAAVSRAAARPPMAELEAVEAPQGTALKLLSRTPDPGVDPNLQAAYEAYSRGDDATAQMQYRQVLQADKRNVDALLGMAAIAFRQSRHADANGWYQKVLEIEPRNSTALSGVANLQMDSESAGAVAVDYAGRESHIKSLLALQPEAANLHAALGNLYAAQNQWPQAQAAYFNASRYAPDSTDYAFNLAVSLDQLGKSGLALTQYQRALVLLNDSGSGSVDKIQLEARIKSLQQQMDNARN